MENQTNDREALRNLRSEIKKAIIQLSSVSITIKNGEDHEETHVGILRRGFNGQKNRLYLISKNNGSKPAILPLKVKEIISIHT